MISQLEQVILSTIQSAFDFLGWAGVAGLLVIEGATGAMPGEVILALAGWMLLAAEGKPVSGILAGGLFAALGSLIGASTTYWFARLGGPYMANRITGWLRISPRHMTRAEDLFQRWGALFALFGRLIPGVRTFIAIPAGVARMDFPKFAFYTFVGAYVWCTAVIGFGYYMGQEWWRIREILALLTPWLIISGVVGVGVLLVWTLYRRRKYA